MRKCRVYRFNVCVCGLWVLYCEFRCWHMRHLHWHHVWDFHVCLRLVLGLLLLVVHLRFHMIHCGC